METKLITKTIKELADEFDGNVEQLHRVIASRDAQILRLQEDNEQLNYNTELERWARARAEKKSEVDTFVMMLCLIVSTGTIVINMLFIW